jgi:hypothetical protein
MSKFYQISQCPATSAGPAGVPVLPSPRPLARPHVLALPLMVAWVGGLYDKVMFILEPNPITRPRTALAAGDTTVVMGGASRRPIPTRGAQFVTAKECASAIVKSAISVHAITTEERRFPYLRLFPRTLLKSLQKKLIKSRHRGHALQPLPTASPLS